MRFALIAFSAAALAALAGCSDPVPQTPDAAWMVNTVHDNPNCLIQDTTKSFGMVTSAGPRPGMVETDGINMAMINCSVSGTTSFAVDASTQTTQDGGSSLQIIIASISKSATMAMPAVGEVSYQSDKTVANYGSHACNFYFEGSAEGVSAGKIWVSFQCPALMGGMSTCQLSQGYAIFENCLTTAPTM
jgi:hypothetical protein